MFLQDGRGRQFPLLLPKLGVSGSHASMSSFSLITFPLADLMLWKGRQQSRELLPVFLLALPSVRKKKKNPPKLSYLVVFVSVFRLYSSHLSLKRPGEVQ